MSDPEVRTLEWAANVVARHARVASVGSLKSGGCTWAVRISSDDVITQAVLKTGPSVDWRDAYACEAAALELAHEHQLPVPRVLGVDLDGKGEEPVALLMTWIEGSSTVPRVASPERLRAVGRLAGTLHQIPLEPSSDLPARKRHTAWTDFALWRRLAVRYRTAAEHQREAVLLEVMTELPGWSREATEDLLGRTDSTSLLDEADRRLQAMPIPQEPTMFLHGDFWEGNTMWDGDRVVGLIDWETAGAGHPGVDLGCLRWDTAVLFGASAPDHISAGWTEVTGREPDSQAYWDLVSALNVPADIGQLIPSFHEAGRTDLDAQAVRDRQEAFLRDALDRLNEQNQ